MFNIIVFIFILLKYVRNDVMDTQDILWRTIVGGASVCLGRRVLYEEPIIRRDGFRMPEPSGNPVPRPVLWWQWEGLE